MSDRIKDIVDRARSFMESDVYALEEHPGRKAFYSLLPALEEKRQKVRVACRPSKKGRIDDLF